MEFNYPIIILIATLAIAYFWYVSLIGKKNQALEALSGIDVQLKKRSNLIPNILKIAKKFMDHEKDLMTQITQLRANAIKPYDKTNQDQLKEHLESVRNLDNAMSGFMVNVENYPDLKSDKSMLQAQMTYNEIEEQISASRRFYNSAVTALNNSVEIFPGNVIASIAKVQKMPFYEADQQAKKPVNASDFLN